MAAFSAIFFCLQAVLIQQSLAQYLPGYGLQQGLIPSQLPLINPGYNLINPISSFGAIPTFQQGVPSCAGPALIGQNIWPTIPNIPTIPTIPTIPSYPTIPTIPSIPSIPGNCGDVSVVGNSLGVGGAVGVNGAMPVSGCVGFSGNVPALGYASVIGGCSCSSPLIY